MALPGQRAFKLLKKIGFVRVGGTKEELQAAQILQQEITSLGLEGKIQPFMIPFYEVKAVKLEILSPKYQVIEATAYGLSGSTNEEGIEGELLYVENALEANLVEAEGKIVLINSRMGIEAYERIIKAKAKAFISFSGTIIDKENESDLEHRYLRPHHLKHGQLPGVTIRAKAAFSLVKNPPKRVRITLIQNEIEVQSHNLVVTVPGSKFPQEEIAIFGHYDSVLFSTGVYDNGAGSVLVMELLHYFAKHRPARTLHFIWFGSEERGLLGARAFVEANDISRYRMAINIDVAGPILGADRALVTADMELTNYLDYCAKIHGFPLEVKQQVYSSDSTIFADKGIPAVSFCRFGTEGGAFIHNRHDVLSVLSAQALEQTLGFLIEFTKELVHARVFPIQKKIPQNMIDEVNKYLRKTQ